ncbi:sterol desaturase family protein [Solitalea koreensis]|uniref:Sterol desaturase/sphingolipid hydroxylase, fatty acid hydroxylase superfamily n=1 Tax=Solitalea koreensis TaxID=543615 RepID=A0A521E572_9SPHI|nr:sterol desaturase family protein [Solitalea koreensis]SMO79025.1 Sterol desaturase/sphingolipid hydroxylase, fatty acid hydroxylase superfamily [Solitalea koreensis]
MKIDYIALSIPVFFILIGVELAYTFYKKLAYYRLNDSLANLSQGIGSQLIGLFLKTVTFFGYLYIFNHWKVYVFHNSFLTWILLFLSVDFFYYWFHRMSHEVNALWAAHIVHHQSEEYNLTVALRQSWFQGGFSWVFFLPLAFVGFEPIMMLTVSSFNTLYQFWIHTRMINKMGPLEWIFNTPSHHRVHHGSNPKYIDKNHAGSLIIWDRMFGTFQKEEEEVVYGITKPLASWDPTWANFHYWFDLFTVAKKSKNVKDTLALFIKPPGWLPEYLGGMQYAPEIDLASYKKYNPEYNKRALFYILFQFVLALGLASTLLFTYSKLTLAQLVFASVFVLFTLTTCGALLEQRKSLLKFECYRLIFGIAGTFLFINRPFFNILLVSNIVLVVTSFIWFYKTKEKNIPDIVDA